MMWAGSGAAPEAIRRTRPGHITEGERVEGKREKGGRGGKGEESEEQGGMSGQLEHMCKSCCLTATKEKVRFVCVCVVVCEY